MKGEYLGSASRAAGALLLHHQQLRLALIICLPLIQSSLSQHSTKFRT